jgi:hypothetical protein
MNLPGRFLRPQPHDLDLEFGDRVTQCGDAFTPGEVRPFQAAAPAQAFGAFSLSRMRGTTRNGAREAIQLSM